MTSKAKRKKVQDAVRKFNEIYPHIKDWSLSMLISDRRNHQLIYNLFDEEKHPNMRWETLDKIEKFVTTYHAKKRGKI